MLETVCSEPLLHSIQQPDTFQLVSRPARVKGKSGGCEVFLLPSTSRLSEPSTPLSAEKMNAHHKKSTYRPPPPRTAQHFSSNTLKLPLEKGDKEPTAARQLWRAIERVPFGWQVSLTTFYRSQPSLALTRSEVNSWMSSSPKLELRGKEDSSIGSRES